MKLFYRFEFAFGFFDSQLTDLIFEVYDFFWRESVRLCYDWDDVDFVVKPGNKNKVLC
jgi:hypothetical protein